MLLVGTSHATSSSSSSSVAMLSTTRLISRLFAWWKRSYVMWGMCVNVSLYGWLVINLCVVQRKHWTRAETGTRDNCSCGKLHSELCIYYNDILCPSMWTVITVWTTCVDYVCAYGAWQFCQQWIIFHEISWVSLYLGGAKIDFRMLCYAEDMCEAQCTCCNGSFAYRVTCVRN